MSYEIEYLPHRIMVTHEFDMQAPMDAPIRSREEKERQDNERFLKHLEEASKIVATWPEWKRNILGGHK